MKRMPAAIVVLLALALAACASTPVVYTDFDRSAQFGNYHTYAWSEQKPEAPDQTAPPMQQRPYEAVSPMQRRTDQAAPGSVVCSALASSIRSSSVGSHHPNALANPASPQANWGSMKLRAPR